MCGPTGIPGKGALHQLPIDMPSSARALRFKLLLSTTLVVSAVLTSGTAASVFVASDTARRTASERQLSELSLDPYRHTPAIRALLDTLLAPLGPPEVLDSAALQATVALTSASGREGESSANSVWIAAPRTKSDSISDPETALLRRWARSAPLPPLWGYRVGLGHPATPWAFPTRAWRPVMQFIRQNERDADSALVHGDVATATLRARETIAAARHFTEQPTSIDMVVGRAIMIKGAKLLARAARQGDEPVISSQAKRLAELVRVNYALSRPQMARLFTLGADLSDGRLHAIAADRNLPPAIRMATLDAALVGACLRTREVLLGVTAERRNGMAQLAWSVSDIRRTEELTPAYFHALDAFGGNGLADHGTKTAPRDDGNATPVRWMVPRGVRHRYAFCRGAM